MLQRLVHQASHARSHVYHVAQHSDKAAPEELYPSTVVLAAGEKIYHGDLTKQLPVVSATRQIAVQRCQTEHAVHVALGQSLPLRLALVPHRT